MTATKHGAIYIGPAIREVQVTPATLPLPFLLPDFDPDYEPVVEPEYEPAVEEPA